MLRFLALVAVAGLVVALLGGRRFRPVGIVILALAVIYTVLKLTGVIDAARPDRIGVF